MRPVDLDSALEGILFAAGESVSAQRIAAVLGVATESVFESAERLSRQYDGRGIRLVRMDNSLQLTSAPEHAEYITAVLETRRPPKLSQAALEVLALVAYYQPVTKAYIDRARGVDSSYTVSTLTDRELIEQAGRLDVPGRPLLYRTGEVFLRTMGIESLDELPKLPDIASDEGMRLLKARIDEIQGVSAQLILDGDDEEGCV